MDEQERLLLNKRAIEQLRDRIQGESYVPLPSVCKRLGLSRAVVRALPMEVLPYVPYGRGTREHRRYHPADVVAADARIRGWERAKQRGQGDAYLEKLKAELEAMDEQAIALAKRMREAS